MSKDKVAFLGALPRITGLRGIATGISALGHVEVGETVIASPPPTSQQIPIKPLDWIDTIKMDPQPRPSKHRNSKTKKRKPNGKKTHRKK